MSVFPSTVGREHQEFTLDDAHTECPYLSIPISFATR